MLGRKRELFRHVHRGRQVLRRTDAWRGGWFPPISRASPIIELTDGDPPCTYLTGLFFPSGLGSIQTGVSFLDLISTVLNLT